MEPGLGEASRTRQPAARSDVRTNKTEKEEMEMVRYSEKELKKAVRDCKKDISEKYGKPVKVVEWAICLGEGISCLQIIARTSAGPKVWNMAI